MHTSELDGPVGYVDYVAWFNECFDSVDDTLTSDDRDVFVNCLIQGPVDILSIDRESIRQSCDDSSIQDVDGVVRYVIIVDI